MADATGTNSPTGVSSGSVASGDLSGTYPSPTVGKIGGVTPGPAATATIGQIPGIASNTAAVAGNIGEYISSALASGSAFALANNTATSVISIPLAAGDYDVWGNVFVTIPAATVVTEIQAGVSSNATTLPNATTGQLNQISLGAGVTGGQDLGCPSGVGQMLLAAAGTAFLVTNVRFTTSTASVYGVIQARRRR